MKRSDAVATIHDEWMDGWMRDDDDVSGLEIVSFMFQCYYDRKARIEMHADSK